MVGVVGHLRRLIEWGAARGPEPPVALIPGHRVQPGPEPVLVAERGKLRRGDDERVLDGVSRVRWLGEQGLAVGVKARRVAIKGRGEPGWVVRDNSGHDLAVEHGITLELIRADPGGFRGIGISAWTHAEDGAFWGAGRT